MFAYDDDGSGQQLVDVNLFIQQTILMGEQISHNLVGKEGMEEGFLSSPCESNNIHTLLESMGNSGHYDVINVVMVIVVLVKVIVVLVVEVIVVLVCWSLWR